MTDDQVTGALVILGLAFTMIPIVVANVRNHKNTMAIVILSLFLGWTFVGWVIALVWACTSNVDTPTKTITNANDNGSEA